MESKCNISDVQIAAMASPPMRIFPQANANQVADLLMPLLRQEIREQFGAMLAELRGAMQAELREQFDAFRHETQQQFRILQHNMAALAFNSSAVYPEAPIRPLMNDAALLPDRFPSTLRDFHDLTAAAARIFLRFYQIPLPGRGNAKRLLASHIGLRAAT